MSGRSSAVKFADGHVHLQRPALGGRPGQGEHSLQKLIRIRETGSPLSISPEVGVVTLQNVLPHFEISGNERFTALIQLKSTCEKQQRGGRSESTPGRG